MENGHCVEGPRPVPSGTLLVRVGLLFTPFGVFFKV
jgi:hypothetical protein